MLKPGGKLAAWCYSFPVIEHHAEADRVFRDFRENVLGPHKTDVMSHCERQYRSIEPSAQDFGTVERDTMPYRLETTVWHLVRASHCLCWRPDSQVVTNIYWEVQPWESVHSIRSSTSVHT